MTNSSLRNIKKKHDKEKNNYHSKVWKIFWRGATYHWIQLYNDDEAGITVFKLKHFIYLFVVINVDLSIPRLENITIKRITIIQKYEKYVKEMQP